MDRMEEVKQIPTFHLFNVPIMSFSDLHHVQEYISARIIKNKKTVCFAINPEKIYQALNDSSFQKILEQAEVTICDGTGVAVAIWLLYGKKVSRCTGFDLFFKMVQWAEKQRYSVFFLGAEERINKVATYSLEKHYPRLHIRGKHHGFFSDDEKIIKLINESGAELLFVAMGSPKQEMWISKYRDRLNPLLMMGIGGTLDVVGGKIKKVPDVIQKIGLGFLYRLILQPSRIKRQLVLPKFALKVLKEKISLKDNIQ